MLFRGNCLSLSLSLSAGLSVFMVEIVGITRCRCSTMSSDRLALFRVDRVPVCGRKTDLSR